MNYLWMKSNEPMPTGPNLMNECLLDKDSICGLVGTWCEQPSQTSAFTIALCTKVESS